MFKSPSFCYFLHLRLILLTVAISVSDFIPVQSARSSSSVDSNGGGESSTLSIQANSSSLTRHNRDSGDRAPISSQFRAAPNGVKESSISGMEAVSSAFSSSVPSSYYPYNAYSYKDFNPMLDTYPYYERDRVRDLKEMAIQGAHSAPNWSSSSSPKNNKGGYGGRGGGYNEGYRDYDNSAMSSGHGDHGGHGWGWPSKFSNKAIGLLGLLGLLSLLSNVLMQLTTTTTTTTAAARAARLKRSYGKLDDEMDETREQKMERIFTEILPHLTPIAHAKDGIIPVECTLHGICMTNQVLVNELGINGRMAAQRISSAVVKLLEKVEKSPAKHNNGKQKSEIKYNLKKKLKSAGLHGRNRGNCEKSYPVCSTLQHQPGPSLPFAIRMHDLPKLISKVSNLSGIGGGVVPMDL